MEICGKLLGSSLLRRNSASAAPQELQLSACSACAGDYEDPDRTAWVTDGGAGEDADATQAGGKEFLAED